VSAQDRAAVPSFDDLPFVPGRTDERQAWEVWGPSDNIGSINRVGSAQVLAAARLVRTGDVVSLSLPLDEPSPGVYFHREPYVHTPHRTANGRDDKIDNLYLQFSSQWDGLRHMRYRDRYWGGRTDEDLDSSTDIGIEYWAQRGLIGRGVLIDVVAYQESIGRPIEFTESFEITPELIESIAASEGVRFTPGDFLIVRTGWIEGYRSLDLEARQAMQGTIGKGFACPGLESSQTTAKWLWDTGIAGVACDNPAVEVLPVNREKGFLHRRMIALQGMAVGEFWWLGDLAQRCSEAKTYDFMLTSAPLNIAGGIGTPSNAYAIM
jgi:kynurenine formamidase